MCFRSDKDDAGRQLDPTEIPSRTAIQAPGDATELGEKGVPTLDGAADAADTGLPGAAALGRLHPKTRRVGASIAGAVAVGTIGTGAGQIPRVRVGHGGFRRWWSHDQRLQHRLRLHAVVGPRLGHDGAQWQTASFGR
jgi:hypothetical protein